MKHLLAVIAALALASCASSAQIGGMVAVPSSQLDANSQLQSAVSLGNILGGQGTQGLRASEVSSLAFEEALRQSLAAQGILAQDEARFRLDAQLEGIVHPLFGYNMTVTSTVNYTLTEIATSSVVFQQEISESDTAALAVAFSGEDRLRLALEGSIKANITSFIELLRQSVENSTHATAKPKPIERFSRLWRRVYDRKMTQPSIA